MGNQPKRSNTQNSSPLDAADETANRTRKERYGT